MNIMLRLFMRGKYEHGLKQWMGSLDFVTNMPDRLVGGCQPAEIV